MNKKVPILLSFFSGSILVSFFLTIVAMVLSTNLYNNDYIFGGIGFENRNAFIDYLNQFGVRPIEFYASSSTVDYGLLQAVTALTYVGLVLELVSIIGTFVTSIVMLVKSKNVHSNIKGFVKGVAITAIVISSVSLFFSLLGTFVITFLAYVCFAGMLVTFGLSIAVNVKYKKINLTYMLSNTKNNICDLISSCNIICH